MSQHTRLAEHAEGTSRSGTTVPGKRGHPALAYVRNARHDYYLQRRKSLAFVLYIVALLGGLWAVPALVSAVRSGNALGAYQLTAARATTVVSALGPVLALLTIVLMVRSAVWRGPVKADAPTVAWLLPSPVPRALLLLPGLRGALGVGGGTGLVIGGVAGFVLSQLIDAPWLPATAAGGFGGAATVVLGSSLGVLVERYDVWMLNHASRVFAPAWAVFVACLVGGGSVLSTAGLPWVRSALLWSGPWGWAVQPLVAALSAEGTSWGFALALAVLSVAAALLCAFRVLPGIPQSALRARAAIAAHMTASLYMLDLRHAKSYVPRLKQGRSRPVLRLPPPRGRLLIVPWRDATGLLREPRRLVWSLLWSMAAVAAALAAPDLGSALQRMAQGAALIAAYLSAAQLTEPARLESDDIRRSTNLPFTAGRLALLHAVVPVLLLAVVLGSAAAATAVAGGFWWATLSLTAAVPALVAAALVSSYRGVMPTHVLIGTMTPLGNTGPWQALLWHLRGPLTVLSLTAPVLIQVTHRGSYPPLLLLWQLLLAVAAMWWARRTARRLQRG
ncbi:hypothetical protein AB0D24_04170 [Streptomyces javensis]|uniref:hypothetical protein n=1 Tax=Streptomyces javensis TaxID=114698 RepID=UPI0033F2B90E